MVGVLNHRNGQMLRTRASHTSHAGGQLTYSWYLSDHFLNDVTKAADVRLCF